MASSVREMLAEANASVPRLNPAEAREMIGKGNVLLVDVRDAPEFASGGKLKGAVNVPRGMLEFRADRKARSTIRRFRRTRLSWSTVAPAAAPH
jgi:predicted sulfurtransferase